MTREELISILHTKHFSCLGAMCSYFQECGFDYEITHDNWEDISVTLTHGDLKFSTSYDPWCGYWEVYVFAEDGKTEATILLQDYLK